MVGIAQTNSSQRGLRFGGARLQLMLTETTKAKTAPIAAATRMLMLVIFEEATKGNLILVILAMKLDV